MPITISARSRRRAAPRLILALLTWGLTVFLVSAVPAAHGEQASADHARVAAASLALGDEHSCVLTSTGGVRCWGEGDHGRLGYGNTVDRGDNETPAVAGDVDLGGTAVAISAGSRHTCALLTTQRVRCWGSGNSGQLGHGSATDIGDNETPASVGDVPAGGKVKAISAGAEHTCAVLVSGAVRCWGEGDDGRLGYDSTTDIGAADTPADAGNVPLGSKATAISAGDRHTCALLTTRKVRCWGYGFAGRLGYGDEESIGDDETPASAGDVKVGGPVLAVSAGALHTCALLTKGRARCWGRGLHGRLGYGNGLDIGNDENPSAAGNIDFDDKAVSVTAGGEHSCAIMQDSYLRCWGRSIYGQLGYGNQDTVGNPTTPADAGNVPVLEPVVAVEAGADHTCAIVRGGFVRCWGHGGQGRLGTADTDDIGDNEVAHTPGRIELGATARALAATTMTVRVTPKRDRRAPYVFTARGRIRGTFVVDAATCGGKARITARRPDGTTVGRRQVKVSPTCRFKGSVEVAGHKVPAKVRELELRVRFVGGPDLEATVRERTVKVRG